MADEIIDDELEPKPAKLNEDGTPRKPLPDAAIPFQFKKGQSGNPGGRPKNKPFKKALEKFLHADPTKPLPEPTTKLEEIARNLVVQASAKGVVKKNGDVKMSPTTFRCIKEIQDRIEGKAMPSSEELESNRGNKVVILAPGMIPPPEEEPAEE